MWVMDTCPSNLELNAYHDGELDDARREELERHLVYCMACVAQLSELQMLSGMFAMAPARMLSEVGVRRLHRRVDGEMDQGIIRLARVLSAIAACVVLVGSFWLTRMHDQTAGSAPPWVMPKNVEEASVQNLASPVGQWYLADASQQ